MNPRNLLLMLWQYVAIAFILISTIMLIDNPSDKTYWIVLIVAIVAEIARFAIGRSSQAITPAKERNSMYKVFFYGICGIIVILMLVGVWGIYTLHNSAFQSIAMIIIILWSCVFLGYFIWGIYFYNINLGITEEEWDRIEENKRRKAAGENYSESEIKEEPKYNPYADETFGLPPGTVRGMIAFTLLFGAISMLVMSIGMKDCSDCQTVLHDQYEFFKTAFLMMIAFYFGSRSLEVLMGKPNAPAALLNNTDGSSGPPITGLPTKDPTAITNTDAPINPMQPATASTITTSSTSLQEKSSATTSSPKSDVDIQFINPMTKK